MFAAVLGLGSAVPAHAQTNLVVAFDKTDYRVVEGNSLTVTVTLSPAADRQVVIPIEVTPHTLAGVAAETADYTVTGLTGGNLTFAIGNASKTFVVTANQDTDLVIDDVNLDFGTLPAAVTSSRASDSYRAVVRILDDDFTKTGTAREDQPSNRFFTEVGVPKDPEGNEIIWWIDGPESRFFWVFPYTEHATHDFGFFLVRSGVVLDRAVKDRYEFFFYYSDGNETSGADPGCSPSTASACRADYRGTIVVNVTDAPEMGAALLRRAFPPCSWAFALAGAPSWVRRTGGQHSPPPVFGQPEQPARPNHGAWALRSVPSGAPPGHSRGVLVPFHGKGDAAAMTVVTTRFSGGAFRVASGATSGRDCMDRRRRRAGEAPKTVGVYHPVVWNAKQRLRAC